MKRQNQPAFSFYRVISSTFVVIAMSCLSSNQLSAQTTLGGIAVFSTDASGGVFGGDVWNTHGGDAPVNIYVMDGSDVFNSPFINGPGDAQAAISIPLVPGVHTYTMVGGSGAPQAYFGINLFFNGNEVNPGISAFAPVQTNSTIPSFAANGNASTFILSGAALVSGANSLTFQDANMVVTLTSYRWVNPSVYNVDRTSAPFGSKGTVGQDGVPDWVGQITLNVVPVPEPTTSVLFASGLAGLIVWARTRSDRRRRN